LARSRSRLTTRHRRLLLDYGLRKGALRSVQFKHFDHYRKRLTVYHSDGSTRMDETLFRDQPMGVHGLHD
jgi:hypothetical protein